MKLVAIISIIFIFLLLYRVGYMKKNTRGKNIYIGVFIGMIIINGFILYDYVQVKSIHNYSTYVTYQNLLERIQDVAQFELEDVSGIKEFSDSVDRLNLQVSLLRHQIDEASLIRGSKKDIISNLDYLSLELHAFSNYQSGIFTREDELPENIIPLYNEFKTKFVELKNVLEVNEDRLGGNLIGIVQYRLRPERGQFKELDNVLESITEINSRLMQL